MQNRGSMAKAALISLILHSLLIVLMVWSTEFSIARFISTREEVKLSGVVEVNLIYRPTETAMRRGQTRTELPPPQVRTETQAPQTAMPKPSPPRPVPQAKPATPQPKTPEASKPEAPKPPDLEDRRRDMRALIDRMRQEQGIIADRLPRDDNYPTIEDGEEGGRGTGGTAQIQARPSLLALQSAMRKHFELPVGNRLKETHPTALGYFRVRLVGVGNQFEIASLSLVESSGIAILDRSCELAIRQALSQEIFGPDVIADLTGKEEIIQCYP
ncbi:MAG: hypothetical protein EA369_01335 [Bradymonadales bacterium]|nr:MAG: hypothetical protein EA369_01335 [Bradymonadales bacterium]